MDLQERLQAVQAEHQEISQQIADGDARIAESQRAYEESQRNYYEARANAQLRVSFLEGQMTAYSEQMQDDALKQTQDGTSDMNDVLQKIVDMPPMNGINERLEVESDA